MKKAKRFIQLQALLIALFIIAALPGQASAFMLCRSDPQVILSNGMVLDFGATISTLPMFVEEVHYELHVPVGVKMILAVHTPTWLTSQETFTFFADQKPGEYKIYTQVETTQGDASVTADATLVAVGLQNLQLLKTRLGVFTAPGREGDWLKIAFRN